MSQFIASQLRFAGSLTPTAISGGSATLGSSLTIPANSSWVVNFFQAHNHTSGGAAFSATLADASSNVYARLEGTGQGSYAIDNDGKEISPVIQSSNALALTVSITGTNGNSVSGGANLEQAYVDPTA